jgi:hypothetical protein
MTLFYFALDLAIANAYILFKSFGGLNSSVPQVTFRMRLVSGLIHAADQLERESGDFSTDSDAELPEAARRRRWDRRQTEEVTNHTPRLVWLDTGSQLNCDACYRRDRTRVRAQVACSVCSKRFCHSKRSDCFSAEHGISVDVARK